MLYSLARPLLFALDPERAHDIALTGLHMAARLGIARGFAGSKVNTPTTVMGLAFPNPVGLAAGLDKNAEHIDSLSQLGFGFLEVGTVTPRPQPGNPPKRLFRIATARALINRMGFNNCGVEQFVSNVRAARYKGVLGINIGKNFDTPIERALDDYRYCLRAVYEYASYVTINISSPNTQNLRSLQEGPALDQLLAGLARERKDLSEKRGRRVPIALKIAPDLDRADVDFAAQCACRNEMDAIIATNTTVARPGIEDLRDADQAGGLSGAPLRERATTIVGWLSESLAGQLPIIAVGGIMNAVDAVEKVSAGASLIQLYTGLIYRGPRLVSECAQALHTYLSEHR
ncbi:MAG: quinone-dependent dihydroorotate dehydrogenase [Betaproteobacteria bacterium]|jgi:dihydroorotate dehydrogenase|nr:MAG: quinone-dependent dihydroorotate dehydrogenase [Betaproteobacteria bacterium]